MAHHRCSSAVVLDGSDLTTCKSQARKSAFEAYHHASWPLKASKRIARSCDYILSLSCYSWLTFFISLSVIVLAASSEVICGVLYSIVCQRFCIWYGDVCSMEPELHCFKMPRWVDSLACRENLSQHRQGIQRRYQWTNFTFFCQGPLTIARPSCTFSFNWPWSMFQQGTVDPLFQCPAPHLLQTPPAVPTNQQLIPTKGHPLPRQAIQDKLSRECLRTA
jgi:hypothetical protein